jgi:hypothetical protein
MGPNVTELRPGDHVVATVRRPGSSIYDRIGTYDMTWDPAVELADAAGYLDADERC